MKQHLVACRVVGVGPWNPGPVGDQEHMRAHGPPCERTCTSPPVCTYVHRAYGMHVRAQRLDCACTCAAARLCTYVHAIGVGMRLSSVRDLGLYIRDRRRRLGLTQVGLSLSAQVSRRWLSDLEAGKPTAEVGLVFKVLHALEVTLNASPTELGPGELDLDDILRAHGDVETGSTFSD
jgi:y4mF family transcriptional regulator